MGLLDDADNVKDNAQDKAKEWTRRDDNVSASEQEEDIRDDGTGMNAINPDIE